MFSTTHPRYDNDTKHNCLFDLRAAIEEECVKIRQIYS